MLRVGRLHGLTEFEAALRLGLPGRGVLRACCGVCFSYCVRWTGRTVATFSTTASSTSPTIAPAAAVSARSILPTPFYGSILRAAQFRR